MVGMNYLPPFGTLCSFVSTVPTWGVFAYVLPIAIYLIPPVLYGVLTALLCVGLLFNRSLRYNFRPNSVIEIRKHSGRTHISTRELKV